MSGNPLFGDWGRSPRGSDPDVEHWPTPVGQVCLLCDEEIAEGDVGEFMPNWRDVVTIEPVHRECLMLRVVGHAFGVCSCNDYAGLGEDSRAAALELARRVDSGQEPDFT